jgi:lysophospholipase L1-like esterase
MKVALAVILSALAFFLGIVLAFRLELTWICEASIFILGVAAVASGFLRSDRLARAAVGLAWVASLFITTAFLSFDSRCTIIVGLLVVGLLSSVSRLVCETAKSRLKLLVVAWALAGGMFLLTLGYARYEPMKFFPGLAVCVGALIWVRAWFRMSAISIQAVNTALLLMIGLPAFDWMANPPLSAPKDVDPAKKYYSFDVAKKDPDGYARWAVYFEEQMSAMAPQIYTNGGSRDLPWRLKPGSQGSLAQSRFSINRHGFRGKEIAEPKGDVYRIVALGESTTFGLTLTPGHHPWPELLEEMIRDRLKPSRPVEVINAGVSGLDLEQNLIRLRKDILPLKPDMILSYHGCFNGLHLLGDQLEGIYSEPLRYRRRPVKLFADLEYRIKVIWFRHQEIERLLKYPPHLADPMQTRYCRAYERLIEIARTNGIRLELSNYSMAVNNQSSPEILQFYRLMDAQLDWLIAANQAHSTIVTTLARQHPEVGLVDTHPHLDGEYGKFIDFMHFTADGDRQLAENFFAGISNVLKQDLGMPPQSPSR